MTKTEIKIGQEIQPIKAFKTINYAPIRPGPEDDRSDMNCDVTCHYGHIGSMLNFV